MPKRRKSRGKRRYRGRKKGKSKPSSRKHSVLVEYGGLYDGAKVLMSDSGGQTLGRRLMSAPFDPAQRQALMGQLTTPGSQLRQVLRNETKEVQIGVALEIGRQIAPTRKLINKADAVLRKFAGKKYKW